MATTFAALDLAPPLLQALADVPHHAESYVRMRRVRIRNKPVTVKLATPRGYEPARKRGGPRGRHAA